MHPPTQPSTSAHPCSPGLVAAQALPHPGGVQEAGDQQRGQGGAGKGQHLRVQWGRAAKAAKSSLQCL